MIDAVVVGAGLAGLAAAEQLQRLGRSVVVCEAAGRVGGRCHTERECFAPQHVELGGEFIDEHHTYVHAVVGRFGLHLDAVGAVTSLATLVVREGERYHFDALPAVASADLARLREEVARLTRHVDPFDVLGNEALDALDDRSIAAWLDDLDLDPLARFVVDDDIRTGNMLDPSESSLAELAWDEALVRAGGHERFRVREGNDALAYALVGALDGKPLLGEPVLRVDHGDDGVVVHTAATSVSAAYVVLTCPLAALRAIEMCPVVPAAWDRAARELRYGRGGKVLFGYAERWWRAQGWSGRVVADGLVRHVWEPTETQAGPGGVLTIDVSSDRSALDASDDELIADLARLFPGAPVDRLVASRRIDWDREPGLGGSYVRYGPGQVRRHARALREPHGRLVLAGEHADDFIGYLEGALRSGVRAARWVDRQLAR